MATHQEIANVTDEELVNRMISSHDDRFDEHFWSFYEEFVDPHLSDDASILDIGCGPGLFLRDLRKRYPTTRLFGTDVTGAMIDYAEKVDYAGQKPHFSRHDIMQESLPFEGGQLNLVSMVAVLHVLNDPFTVCKEIQRVLADGGIFLLQDWIRSPLPDYLDRMTPDVPEDQKLLGRSRLMALFTVHNKYTTDDWLWLLKESGWSVNKHRQLRSPHFCTFVCRKPPSGGG